MTHAELRERAARAIYDAVNPGVSDWADEADAVLRVVLDAIEAPCDVCGAKRAPHPLREIGVLHRHAYVLPAHLAVLEENDRG